MKMQARFLNLHIFGITIMLLIISSANSLSAASSPNVTEWVYGYVRDENGSPLGDVDVSIFDGFAIKVVKTETNGFYRIYETPVSIDRYAVLFFTKPGYVPKAVNIKVGEDGGTEYSTVLNRAATPNIGFVTGVIYQPIRGGKIEFQSGIHSFGKKKQVRLGSDGKGMIRVTDREGHFLFEAPPGRYTLSGEGVREKGEVVVSEGQTVIRNLRSGLILVD